ncbi:hypothetical protein JRG48_09650 [Staphylococcus caprae]|uniref:hypothetical protein n=1 Tax=Staphylococcus caprae TaxID=29380 RepID=UPI0019D241DB|nr:hypothetical protein [Staphylococcus caprae]MBN6826582.1 hypothetical protein [Staphylococcus caprae]
MKKLFAITTALTLFLVACNSDNSSEQKKNQNKTETKSTKEKDEKTSSKPHSENKVKDDNQSHTTIEKKTDVRNLSDKTKISLAFFADEKGEYLLTKNEIIAGTYHTLSPFNRDEKVENITIQKIRGYQGAPEGMQFYAVKPSKGNFQSIIGINNQLLFIGGTQGGIENFNQLTQHSKMLNLIDVYEKYKSNAELSIIENKIHFTNSNPELN